MIEASGFNERCKAANVNPSPEYVCSLHKSCGWVEVKSITFYIISEPGGE